MNALEYQVLRLVNEIFLRTRVSSPKHKDKMFTLKAECTDGGIGERLPAKSLMAVGLMGTYCQRSVHEQHTLLLPSRKITACRNRCTEVVVYLLKDVLQGWRHRHSVGNREAQPHCLPWLMIRVLSDDDHLHLVVGAQVEGVEYQLSRGIACRCGIFLAHEVDQVDEVGFFKFLYKMSFPRFFHFHVHDI